MIQLPSQKIAQGEPFASDITVTGQDWTGYTGTASYKTAMQATGRMAREGEEQEPFLRVPVTADSAGLIQYSLTAAQTATFPALPRIGYFRQAVCEIVMTNGADVQRFQAPVSVASRL